MFLVMFLRAVQLGKIGLQSVREYSLSGILDDTYRIICHRFEGLNREI